MHFPLFPAVYCPSVMLLNVQLRLNRLKYPKTYNGCFKFPKFIFFIILDSYELSQNTQKTNIMNDFLA